MPIFVHFAPTWDETLGLGQTRTKEIISSIILFHEAKKSIFIKP
jgi:hypothetical protein